MRTLHPDDENYIRMMRAYPGDSLAWYPAVKYLP